MISRGAVDPLLLGALARGADRVDVHPVAEHVQVVDVPCTQEISAAGTSSMPASAAAATASGNAVDRVVVGQRQRRHARLRRRGRDHPAGGSSPSEYGRMALKVDHERRHSDEMRISAKADYAVRAALELAAAPATSPSRASSSPRPRTSRCSSSSTSCSS